jgi:hypothetical protein
MIFNSQLEWNNRIFITGTSRTGKSWFRDWIIKKYINEDKRRYFIVIDDRLNNLKNLYQEGFYIQNVNRDQLTGYNYEKFIRYHEKIAFLPGDLSGEETEQFINMICNIIWNLTDTLFIVDEGHVLLNRRYEPEEVRRIQRGGAKSGIDTLFVSQRMVDISPDIVGLSNLYCTFRITEPNSIERMLRYYDKFQTQDQNLIDDDLKQKQKNKCKKLIKKDTKQLISSLPNRYFLYSDTEEGIQEITSTEILNQ